MSDTILDPGDPIVVLTSIALGELLKRLLPDHVLAFIRPILPAVIVVLALFGRIVYDTLSGGDVTGESVLRAVASAGVAVMSHTQFRSIVKAVQAAKEPSAA